MQGNRWLQALIVLLVIIAALYLAGTIWAFLIQFANIILLFFLSWLLAFILRPVARWLTTRGIPYTLSVIFVYSVLAVLFGAGGLLLIPIITLQVAQLTANFNLYVDQLSSMADNAQRTITSWGITNVSLNDLYNQLAGQVQVIGMGVLQNTLSVLQSIATLVLQLILVLILSFYFMKDGDRIFGGMLKVLPPRWRDEARLLAISIERSFGAFVRGQVVFALVYALLTAAVMLGFSLDYVVIASIVAGFCMIIPLIGNFLAFAPPILVCLLTRPNDWPWVLFWLFIAQSIMMNFIGPRIMSSAIGIHPLYVVGAMLVGGQVAGFWGALFGIPVAGVINLVGRPLMRRIRYQVPLYREIDAGHISTSSFATGPLSAANLRRPDEQPAPEIAVSHAAATQMVPVPVPAAARVEAGSASPEPDLDEEIYVPRPPTLSGRAWHLLWVFVSRAYAWVGARAHVRQPKH